ncbi:MAG TPA: hypothetical protein VNZ03_22890, partial [Terriglobales bacterium]|nr:hypothetical protein [Terriglobales bacterium]
MVLLQHKLSLKVSQRQILTPGLVQMVSVLALNKLELRDMITAEMVENPVLEELEESVPLLDDVDRRQEDRDRAPVEESPTAAADAEKKDPFEEIDFGSFFSEYLDPGLRTSIEMEDSEKPSFENFLSKPSTLADHLMWQLGSLHVNEDVYRAAELVIGNLNEEGYLTATDDELLGLAQEEAQDAAPAVGQVAVPASPETSAPVVTSSAVEGMEVESLGSTIAVAEFAITENETELEQPEDVAVTEPQIEPVRPQSPRPTLVPPRTTPARVPFSRDALREAIDVVKQMDPIGVGARDLRECLL